MTPHRFFTAERTHRGWAIFFQPAPVQTEHEGQAVGLRLPMLHASENLDDPHIVVSRVAALLEEHWDHKDRDGTPGR